MKRPTDDFRMKYRPHRYAQLWQGVDHPTIKRLLEEEQSVRYPHGMLYVGDYGCGKTSAARIRGMRASCWNYRLDPCEPCGTCAACRNAMTRGNGPDYYEIDATRDNLRATIDYSLTATYTSKEESHPYIPRVFFIDESHRASPETQQTMLQEIEHYPEAIFILSTAQVDKIIPAIRDHFPLYPFEPLTPEQASLHLEAIARAEGLVVEPGVALRIAQAEKGVPRDCLGLLYELSFGGEIRMADVDAVVMERSP
jgi:DNA polymerase III gamma/tau subunit